MSAPAGYTLGPLGNPIPDRFVRPDGTFRSYTADDLSADERERITTWMADNHDRLVATITGRLTA